MPKSVSTRSAYKMLTCIYLCRTLLFFAPYADFLKEIQVWHLPDTEQMPYEKRYTIPDVLYKPLNVLRLACG